MFGQTYSGLEYDYRGLLHVYEELHDNVNYVKFCDILDEWRILRSDEKRVSPGEIRQYCASFKQFQCFSQKPTYVELNEDATVEDVTRKFYEMSADV